MTKYDRFEEDRATGRKLILAAGYPCWEDSDAKQYRADKVAEMPPGVCYRWFGMWTEPAGVLMGTVLTLLTWFGALSILQINSAFYYWTGQYSSYAFFGLAIVQITAISWLLLATVCRMPHLWHVRELADDGIYQDHLGRIHRAPEFVVQLIADIRAFLPDSVFTISILGPDPIITCRSKYGSYDVLIYDGDTIISPPKSIN